MFYFLCFGNVAGNFANISSQSCLAGPKETTTLGVTLAVKQRNVVDKCLTHRDFPYYYYGQASLTITLPESLTLSRKK